jgi:hypothetical protein
VVELQDIALCDHASRSVKERHELIDNPHDPQARFATKRSQSWTGYKLHLTETAAEDAPSLITDVAVVAANSYDAVAVDTIQERLKQRHLLVLMPVSCVSSGRGWSSMKRLDESSMFSCKV